MAKLDFKAQMKQNTKKAKSVLESRADTPASDIFGAEMNAPESEHMKSMEDDKPSALHSDVTRTELHSNVTKTELHSNVTNQKKRGKRHPTSAKSMPGRPLAGPDHKYQEYHPARTNGVAENGETLYVYQVRVTQEIRFWLYTMSSREDKPVYQVVRDILHVMIPEYDKVKVTLTMEDFQPLKGGKQITLYLTNTEINDLKNAAMKKGLKLIHYLDRVLNRYREEYDPAFSEIAQSPDGEK